MSTIYWLIERGSPAEWWVCGSLNERKVVHEEWTRDASQAQRFNEWGAKQHAKELESWGVKGSLRATEHMDCDGPPPYEKLESDAPLILIGPTERNYNITFHNGKGEIGRLDFNGPSMVFTGEAEESARVFFNYVAEQFADRLKQERGASQSAIEQHDPDVQEGSDG